MGVVEVAVVVGVLAIVGAGLLALRVRRRRALAAAAEAERRRREAETAARRAAPPGRRIVRTLSDYAFASLTLLADQVLLDDLGRTARAGEPVGIMFADLVGSTALNVELGDAGYAELMAVHDRVTTRAVEVHGGQVVKRLGDGFMALFPDLAATAPAAVAVREALRDNPDVGRPLAVRIGLHAASVVTDRGDYYGAGVAMAARVAERAKADQILLTDAVADRTPASIGLARVGEVRLDGLPGRHRLHAVKR